MTPAVVDETALPDGDSLLHPLDLPDDARRYWWWGWVLRRAAGPAALLSLIGLAFVPNVAAPAVLVGPPLAWAALSVGAWRMTRAAWGFIPERRREPGPRAAPPRWPLLYAEVSAVVTVVVGVTVLVFGLGPDPAGHTAAFVNGALLVVGIAGIVRLGHRAALRHWSQLAVGLPSLFAVLALTLMARLRLPHGGRGLGGDLFSGAEAVTVVDLFLRAVAALASCLWRRKDTAVDPADLTGSADGPVASTNQRRQQ